jgi:hypothetical protein
MAQPGGQVWTIFNEAIADIARQFADFRSAEAQGAVIRADILTDLARATGLPAEPLARTLDAIPQEGADSFGRDFNGAKLSAPYRAVKVTGALPYARWSRHGSFRSGFAPIRRSFPQPLCSRRHSLRSIRTGRQWLPLRKRPFGRNRDGLHLWPISCCHHHEAVRRCHGRIGDRPVLGFGCGR